MASAADDFHARNSFIITFGVSLWLASNGIVGFWAKPLAALIEFIVGGMADAGILKIDLTIASIKVALQDEKFKDLAKKAYDKTILRVYTYEEKVAIRKQYQDIIREFGSVGNGVVPDSPNP